jgi:ABC-type sugar transport system substrate-binding protein
MSVRNIWRVAWAVSAVAAVAALAVTATSPAAPARNSANPDEQDLHKPLACNSNLAPNQLLAYKVPKAKKKYDITLMEVSLNGYYYQGIAYGATKAAKQAGVTLHVTAASGYTTPATQLQQAQNIVQRGTDAVVFAPVDFQGSVPIVKLFKSKGIPVINESTEVNDAADLTAIIQQDDYKMGVTTAEEIHKLVPSGGAGIFMAGPANATWSRKRTNGFMDTIKKHSDWKITVAGAPTSLVDPAEGLKKFVNASQANPDIKWIANVYYYILPVDSLPPQYQKVPHVTMGFEPGSIDGLKKAYITKALPITPIWMGYMGVGYAITKLNGGQPPKVTCVPFPPQTKATLNSTFGKGELFPASFKATTG